MKLFLMKKNILETAKSNLPNSFPYYYNNNDNQWMWDRYKENPFVEFRDVDDFSLAPLNQELSKGEVDLENCKIIYKNLIFLSESQASDERLWAGLTNGVFYDYMRKRWEYDVKQPKSQKQAVGEIRTRFFFEGGTRAGFFRNTLAKCWWIGHALYDETRANPFEKLDAIGTSNFSTKVSDMFRSNTYVSNPTILNGIVKCFKYFNDEGIKLIAQEHIRPSLQLLNAIGGGIILDCLSEDEIADILIENIERIMQGDESGIESLDDNYIDEDEIQNEQVEDDFRVVLGTEVIASNIATHEEKIYKIDYINGRLPVVVERIIGKKIGDIFESNDDVMRIEDIRFQ